MTKKVFTTHKSKTIKIFTLVLWFLNSSFRYKSVQNQAKIKKWYTTQKEKTSGIF